MWFVRRSGELFAATGGKRQLCALCVAMVIIGGVLQCAGLADAVGQFEGNLVVGLTL